MMYRYWNGNYDMMGPYSGWWFALEILGFILLAIVVVSLFRSYLKHTAHIQGPPSALDIAKARLAKGEITPEEFAAMRDHLK